MKYGDYSKDVEIFVYANTGDKFEFMEIQEDVLLRVQDIIEAAGTDFAFPSQITYLSQDSGIDDFSNEQREHLRDTLDFPPRGLPNGSSASGEGKNVPEN